MNSASAPSPLKAKPSKDLWRHQGQSYRDELTRIFVDASDTPESTAFFREFKETLKSRFQQIDIWMTSHPIEVI